MDEDIVVPMSTSDSHSTYSPPQGVTETKAGVNNSFVVSLIASSIIAVIIGLLFFIAAKRKR